MEDSNYQKAKNLLDRTNRVYYPESLRNIMNGQQFQSFVKILLKRYVDTQDVFNLIKKEYIPKASDSQFKTRNLFWKLREVTGNEQCWKNLSYFLDQQKRNQSHESAILKIKQTLQKLEFFEFPQSHNYQLNLPDKIMRLVDAINIYESFAISISAVKPPSQLEGQQKTLYKRYKNNVCTTVPNMRDYLLSIEKQKEELVNINKQQTERLNQFYDLFKKLSNCIKEKKQLGITNSTIPFFYYFKSQDPVIVDYNEFRTFFNELITSKNIISTPTNYSTSPHISAYQYYEFVNKIYPKFDPTQQAKLSKSKMEMILQVIDSQQSYSSTLTQKLKIYSQLLNPFICDCLKFFGIPKAEGEYCFDFTFTPQDIQNLGERISEQSLKRIKTDTVSQTQAQQQSEVQYYKEKNNDLMKEKEQFLRFIDQIFKLVQSLSFYNAFQQKKQNKMQWIIRQTEQISRRFAQKEKYQVERKERETQVDNLEQKYQEKNSLETDQLKQYYLKVDKQKDKLLFDLNVLKQSIKEHENTIKSNQILLNLKDNQIMQKQEIIAKLQQDLRRTPEEKYAADIKNIRESTQRQIQNHSFEYNELKKQKQQIHQDNILLKTQFEDQQTHFQQKLKKQNKQINELKKIMGQLQNQNEILKHQIAKLESDDHSLRIENKRWKGQNEEISKKYTEKLTEQFDRTFQKISPLLQSQEFVKGILSQLEQEKKSPLTFTQEMQKEKDLENYKIQQLKQDFTKQFEDLINNLKNSERRLQIKLESNEEELKTKDQLLTLIEDNLKIEKEKIETGQRLLAQSEQKNIQLEREVEQLKATIAKYKDKETKRMQNQLLREQRQTSSPKRVRSCLPSMVSYINALFNASIFRDEEYLKDRLVSHLQQYVQSRIVRTDLVYQYDTRNKSNFHLYLDNRKSLALVIKTHNAILAGYYPGTYKEKQIMSEGGLLISVTNDKSYKLNQKKPNGKTTFRGMVYDTYYIIYGNAQIRIKQSLNTVFSNFGVNNSFFDHKGDKIHDLLNQGNNREVELEQYEFYEVSFEREF